MRSESALLAARPGAIAVLQALILNILLRLVGRLDQMMLLWQSGQLSAASSTSRAPARPNSVLLTGCDFLTALVCRADPAADIGLRVPVLVRAGPRAWRSSRVRQTAAMRCAVRILAARANHRMHVSTLARPRTYSRSIPRLRNLAWTSSQIERCL